MNQPGLLKKKSTVGNFPIYFFNVRFCISSEYSKTMATLNSSKLPLKGNCLK